MSSTGKAAGPVTPQELEAMALRVAQAASTLTILGQSAPDIDPDLQNALGLMTDYLDRCACDLSALHARAESNASTEEARP